MYQYSIKVDGENTVLVDELGSIGFRKGIIASVCGNMEEKPIITATLFRHLAEYAIHQAETIEKLESKEDA